MWLYHRVTSLNDADGMANSVDPDQTTPKTKEHYGMFFFFSGLCSVLTSQNTLCHYLPILPAGIQQMEFC